MKPTEYLGKYTIKNGTEGRIVACYYGTEFANNWTYLVVFLQRKNFDNELGRDILEVWEKNHRNALVFHTDIHNYLGSRYAWFYESELELIDPILSLDYILTELKKEIL